MNYQLKRFAVIQTSLVVAAMYFFISLLICIPLGIITMVMPSGSDAFHGMGGIFLFFVPVLYGVLGFFLVALSCLFYNLIARMLGGIAFTLEETK